jgi:hypothetical protein
MATFVDSLSEKGKQNWPELYEKLTGRKWENPTKDKRAIHCEAKIEDISEIAKFMEEVPNPTRRE